MSVSYSLSLVELYTDINLTFLLKDLFVKDKIFNVYAEELSIILKSINPEEIPEDYSELVNQNLDKNLIEKIIYCCKL